MNPLRTAVELAVDDDPHGDPYTLAASIVRQVDVDALIDVIATYVMTYQRERTRRVERMALARLQPVGAAMDRKTEAMNLSRLEGSGFTIASRLRVSWLDATVDDHKARIAYLMNKRQGLDDTIGLHRRAIDRLVTAGVQCLRELSVTDPVRAELTNPD